MIVLVLSVIGSQCSLIGIYILGGAKN